MSIILLGIHSKSGYGSVYAEEIDGVFYLKLEESQREVSKEFFDSIVKEFGKEQAKYRK